MPQFLAMFPGQGSQHVGMGKDLLEQFPAARITFEEAEDASKVKIRKLCFDGPEDELVLTANTQPCILTVSVAAWRVLQKETGFAPVAFAGHSLGEYSAAVASGKLDFARAAYLVRKRGEAMQAAVAPGVGAMAAVINFAADKLEELCKQISDDRMSVEVVNYNSPQQLVVAGHKQAVDALCQQLETEAVRFVVLQVSAPFHSRLMKPAREAMAPLLEDSTFHENEEKLIANLTGDTAEDYGADYLIKQIDSPVRWIQCMETAKDLAIDACLEIGPGKVLFGLARRILPKDVKLHTTVDMRQAVKDLAP